MKARFTVDELVQFHIATQEMAELRLAYASKTFGKNITKSTTVFDLKGLNMSLDKDCITYIKTILGIDQNYYPERLKRLFVINVPWYFTTIFALFKPFVDKRTQDKIIVLGTDYMTALEQHIDRAEIPEYFGGESKDAIWGDLGESSGITFDACVDHVTNKFRASEIEKLLNAEEIAAYMQALAGWGDKYSEVLQSYPVALRGNGDSPWAGAGPSQKAVEDAAPISLSLKAQIENRVSE